ncbi:MAG: hypothetical protein A4S09_15230 [Proteobacteria bacterium SG_bin7]|nr:MAG: hypothetical protein A4S09_15230 [Proteobacteria bacterium SG_bin7]
MRPSKFLVFLTLTNFVLHLVWEYAQCGPLFVHLNKAPTHLNMFLATGGDVIIFWTSYTIGGLFKDSFTWGLKFVSAANWFGFAIISALISASIEHVAIVKRMWVYKSLNPVIPGIDISILPVIQMASLNFITLLIIRRFFLKRSSI